MEISNERYWFINLKGDILNVAFNQGFIVDGFYEVPFEGEDTPIIMTVSLRKFKR